jgi:hypothetical protein
MARMISAFFIRYVLIPISFANFLMRLNSIMCLPFQVILQAGMKTNLQSGVVSATTHPHLNYSQPLCVVKENSSSAT